MERSKPAEKKGSGEQASGGMRAVRGAAAYKKAMGEGFLKTEQPESAEKPIVTTSKYLRAAQFMVLIGSEEASRILSNLDPGQVEAISKEIVTLKTITTKEAEAVLEEFRSLLSSPYGYSGSSSGGIEQARRLLYAAFGPEKGEAMLVKAVPNATENPFDFLSDYSGEQLAVLFRDESPAVCAMVFSRLPSKLSAAALANSSAERKLEIVKRIAKLKETSPEVIARAAGAIKEKARHLGQSAPAAGEEIDGRGVLTAILKHSDIAFSGRLLEGLEASDPSLGREMKDRLYSLEDVANASDRPIQEKLRTMDDRDIALLLKGRSEAFTRKILWNLSSGRADRIREESEIMGAVPKIEAEAAAREFLSWFRDSIDEGRILMLTDKDVLI
jgi:flagellar motor switch protein FliG